MNRTIRLPAHLTDRSLLLIILLCFAVVLFIRIRLVTVYTPNIGGVEQNVIYSCQQLAAGHALYTDPEIPPYAITQYSPLYFHVVAATGNLLGLSPAEPFPWFMLSRFISLVFNLLLLWIAFRTLRLIGTPGLLAGGLSLVIFIFFEQQDYSRPDSLYHLLMAVSYYFLLTVFRKQTSSWLSANLLLAAMFASLALFSKQSGIFIIIIALAAMILTRKNRKYIPGFLLGLLVSILLLSTFLLNSTWEIIYMNLYVGVLNGIDLLWAMKLYFLPALPRFTLFFLISAFFLVRRKSVTHPAKAFLFGASLIYLGIALVSGMKWGSGTNYFFEYCYFTLFLIPLLLTELRSSIPDGLIKSLALSLTVVLVVPQLLIISWRDYYHNDFETYQAEKQMYAETMRSGILGPEDGILIPGRKWLNNFFFESAFLPQPDIFRTLWRPDPAISLLHPRPLPTNRQVFLIQKNQPTATGYFMLSLEDYHTLMESGDYLLKGKSDPLISPSQ